MRKCTRRKKKNAVCCHLTDIDVKMMLVLCCGSCRIAGCALSCTNAMWAISASCPPCGTPYMKAVCWWCTQPHEWTFTGHYTLGQQWSFVDHNQNKDLRGQPACLKSDLLLNSNPPYWCIKQCCLKATKPVAKNKISYKWTHVLVYRAPEHEGAWSLWLQQQPKSNNNIYNRVKTSEDINYFLFKCLNAHWHTVKKGDTQAGSTHILLIIYIYKQVMWKHCSTNKHPNKTSWSSLQHTHLFHQLTWTLGLNSTSGFYRGHISVSRAGATLAASVRLDQHDRHSWREGSTFAGSMGAFKIAAHAAGEGRASTNKTRGRRGSAVGTSSACLTSVQKPSDHMTEQLVYGCRLF